MWIHILSFSDGATTTTEKSQGPGFYQDQYSQLPGSSEGQSHLGLSSGADSVSSSTSANSAADYSALAVSMGTTVAGMAAMFPEQMGGYMKPEPRQHMPPTPPGEWSHLSVSHCVCLLLLVVLQHPWS